METTTREKMPMIDADHKAIIDHNLSRLKLMQQKMDENQREIETMRAETDTVLADLMRSLKAA